jgi:hypothetical protein
VPKAGKYEYPFFDLDACVEKLRQLYDKTQSYKNNRSIVADALGMAMTGGGFTYLMASMEKYGLTQTGGGDVTVTDLGKMLMFGEPNEIEPAKSKAVANVELFREIAQKYGKNPQTEQIKLFLRERANVDLGKAQKLAQNIDTIYKKVSKYITSADKLVAPAKDSMPTIQGLEPSTGRSDSFMQAESEKTELLKIQFGNVYIQVPSDSTCLSSIKLAKDALEFMEQRIIKENKEKKPN